MSLKLYMHPLASFCHKALIAFLRLRNRSQPIALAQWS